jgi:putative flippase GtrA
MNVAVIIPAYRPGQPLVELVKRLSQDNFAAIVVINDGSGSQFNQYFNQIKGLDHVHILQHAINLGKGAALKTGLNFAYCHFEDLIGVVTADADGQHLAADIVSIAESLQQQPDALILGSRSFSDKVPLRSQFGNMITRILFGFLAGCKLGDTQTGLRGIPRSFIPRLLEIEANGYEFELDMLLSCRYDSRRIIEKRINTVYFNENVSSHFNPLTDSMKIYFVLFRFMTISLMTAMMDTAIFLLVFKLSSAIWLAQFFARLVAMVFNYLMVKSKVFRSRVKNSRAIPKYVTLVFMLGLISYGLINFMTWKLGITVLAAKIIAESIIFLSNFALQREFIFRSRSERQNTDWDSYYNKPIPMAKYSRRITEHLLVDLIREYTASFNRPMRVLELGGGDSCFYDAICRHFQPLEYGVVDNNRLGLEHFRNRTTDNPSVSVYDADVLDLHISVEADLVFSVGLIEHFSPTLTRKAIESHFQLLRESGIAIISFPTPTFLYRVTRSAAELLRIWRFPDERPLPLSEVAPAVEKHGEILHTAVIWAIFLTQRILVAKKYGDAGLYRTMTPVLPQ